MHCGAEDNINFTRPLRLTQLRCNSQSINRCASTGKAIPKDKAIKRFIVRNIVDASSLRDIKEASAYQEYQLPKLYLKMYYCVEAAVHQRIVRGRSRENRRIRTPPERKFVRRN